MTKKEKKLVELRKERIQKIKLLSTFVNDIREEMLELDKLQKNSVDYTGLAKAYVNVKENASSIKNEENNVKKNRSGIALKFFESITRDFAEIDSERYIECEFEEFIRENLKYLDINLVVKENKTFNAMTYDMSKDFFYHCIGQLNKISTDNVKTENKEKFNEMLQQFWGIQYTIIELLTLCSSTYFEHRIEKITIKDKGEAKETIYIEKYMAILNNKMESLVINTMKQNFVLLSKKLPDYPSCKSIKTQVELEEEYSNLVNEVEEHINNYEQVSFLPSKYIKCHLSQLNLTETFILKEGKSFEKVRK